MNLYTISGEKIYIDTRLHGKKITAIGDSYTSGATELQSGKVWLDVLAERCGATPVNMGVSGESLKEMVDSGRYNDVPSDTDYLIIFMGHNDVHYHPTPIGAFGDSTNATFYGCMDMMCKIVLNQFPKVRTLFITPTRRSTYDAEPFVDAMLEVCKSYGIPCWDIFREFGIHIGEAKEGVDQRAIFESKTSGNYDLHLNELGNAYLSYKIEEQLKML